VKAEIVQLFSDLASNAESYGAENLFLARRDEGYIGDPKEFRFSHIYARRLPTYKHELLVDYIEEYSKTPHDRLQRRLTEREAGWMRREAKKLYAQEEHAGSEKTSKRLDAEIANALAKRQP
jgi:hypothetical protein